MDWLGVFPELARNFELMGKANIIKQQSLHTAQRYGKAYSVAEGSFTKGMSNIDEEAAKLAEEFGMPGNEMVIATTKDALKNEKIERNKAFMGKLNARYENIRDNTVYGTREYAMSLGLGEEEAADFAQRSWDLSNAAPGVGTVLRQTAVDRANALNITRFRATDGTMTDFNIARSLFYKDNEHLSGKGMAAIGAAGAGALGIGYSVISD